MDWPPFSFSPRSPGCSWGANSVSRPTENLCRCIICLMAGSSESLVRSDRADEGSGRCSSALRLWKRYWKAGDDEEEIVDIGPEPLDRSWRYQWRFPFFHHWVRRLTLTGAFNALSLSIPSTRVCSFSTALSPSKSCLVDPSIWTLIPFFKPASITVVCSISSFPGFLFLNNSFCSAGGTPVNSSSCRCNSARVVVGGMESAWGTPRNATVNEIKSEARKLM